MTAHPLDREAVERLARALARSVLDHYTRRPVSRATAQEVLNALAFNVAIIVCGAREAGDEPGARKFFALALEQQIESMSTPTTLGDLDRWLK